MNLVFLVVAESLHVFHLGIDSLSQEDVSRIPILGDLQTNGSYLDRLKAEPYSDSHHGWSSTFYGVGAAKHCGYYNDNTGCSGIPTLDSVLRDNNISSISYYTHDITLNAKIYFELAHLIDGLPAIENTTDSYTFYYYSNLDTIRHHNGLESKKEANSLEYIQSLIVDVMSGGWEVLLISSDHGWKKCSHGINVFCELHSGARLSEVNTPLYIHDKNNVSGLDHGLIEGPVSHSDIAPTILEWFGINTPCEWAPKIQNCPGSSWPGNEKNINTRFDMFAVAFDSLILVVTIISILLIPLFTRWLLQ